MATASVRDVVRVKASKIIMDGGINAEDAGFREKEESM